MVDLKEPTWLKINRAASLPYSGLHDLYLLKAAEGEEVFNMDLALLLVWIACICLAIAAVFFRINGYPGLGCLFAGFFINEFPYLVGYYLHLHLSFIFLLILVVIGSVIVAIREDARTGVCLIGGFFLGGILWNIFFRILEIFIM